MGDTNKLVYYTSLYIAYLMPIGFGIVGLRRKDDRNFI